MSSRDGFIDAFNSSPLAAEGALEKSRGYAATPLTGVWANYPYLHNGSVPTLYHLLGPASERPEIFEVMAARKLDRERVGQLLYVDPSDCRSSARRSSSAASATIGTGSTRRGPDAANIGHDFWSRIRTDDESPRID